MKRCLAVIAIAALAGTVGLASGAQASVQAKKQPSSTVTACKLALQTVIIESVPPGEAEVVIAPWGPASLPDQALEQAASIKVVKDFKGHVPELLKPNETQLVNAIAADAGTVDLYSDLTLLASTCTNTGVIALMPQQRVDFQRRVQEVTGGQGP